MSEHRIFFKRIASIGVVKIFTSFRGLIILPLLTKTLGVAYYGVWAQILITIGLLTPLLTLNLATPMVRFLAAEKDTKKTAQGIFTVIFTVLAAAGFFSLILFLFSDSTALLLLQDRSYAPFIQLAAAVLIFEVVSQISMDSFRIFGQITTYSFLSIFQTILEVSLIMAAIFLGWGLPGALLALLITRAAVSGIALVYIFWHTGFALPRLSILKPYLAFALPLLPLGLFDILINSGDRFVIGFFKGAVAVGVYSATYSIGFLTVIFIFPIAYILSPTIFKLFDEGQIEKVTMYLSYSLKYFLVFAIPSVFGLTVLAKTLLRTLATSEFVAFNSMIIVLMIALGALLYGVQAVYGQVIMLKKKTSFFILAFGIGVLSNMVLNVILIPYWGPLAAAASTLVAYLLVAALIIGKSRQYVRFEFNTVFVAKSIFASCLMALAIATFNPIGSIQILLAVGGGALVYFSLLLFSRAFSSQEIAFFSSALHIRHIFEIL